MRLVSGLTRVLALCLAASSIHAPGMVAAQGAGAFALQAGDYWEFEWSSTTASTTSSGSHSTRTEGTFRATLGSPQTLGGRTAFPVTVTTTGDDPADVRPVWNYLATDGSQLLGTRDGSVYSTILGSESGGWKGAGFFRFFPPNLANAVTQGTFQGNYRTVSAWVVSRSGSSGGCTYYPEVGQNICTGDPSNYSEREYEKDGIGPVGYLYTTSSSFSGGGFSQFVTITRMVELVKSSKVAADGTAFTGSPWRRLPDIARGAWISGAAPLNGKVYAFGGYLVTGGPPWVQSYDPATGSWSASTASGAEAHRVIGTSGGSLYGIGRTSNAGATSLLRFDTASGRWAVAGTAPSFSNMCGSAVLTSGNLVVLDCPGTSPMSIYVYNRAAARWGTAVSYGSVLLRPAVAAVGDDVYVMGGYASFSSGLTGRIRRFRSATNTWENLTVTMRTARDEAIAAAIGTKIYVMGGTGSSSSVPNRLNEVFDTVTQTWSVAPPLPDSRSRFAATALNDDIFVVGGMDGNNAWLVSGYEYGTISKGGVLTVFGTRGTVTPAARMYGSFVLAKTSVVYIAVLGPSLGILGYTSSPLNLPNVRVYDASGKDVLQNASGGVTVAGCPSSSAVAGYYATVRGGALNANDTCVSANLAAGVYTFTIDPNTPSSSGELLFEVSVNPEALSPGGILTVFGTRGTVTPTARMYGSFVLAKTSVVYIAVLGPSLGILGYTSSPLNLPNVRVYDASGKDVLQNAGGGVTVSGCPSSATVAGYYATVRGGALNANDTCVSATLAAGVYTFTIDPNTASSSGELLFEVSVNP